MRPRNRGVRDRDVWRYAPGSKMHVECLPGRQQRSRTCIEKTAPQANDFIQATNDCTACVTGAQCHQRTRRKVQVEGFDGAQLAVSKLDVREVGCIKAEQAMSCNVYDGTTHSMLPQKRCGGRLI